MLIRTNVKRGKAKVTKDISMPDFFKFYSQKNKSKNSKPVSRDLYYKIISNFNKELVETIVYNNELVKLPYNLGYLGIKKYKVTFDIKKKNIWKVDYKRSKEVGFIVYYDQEYRYRWKWVKHLSKVSGKTFYKFIPCRAASRLIAKALRENGNLDYCETLV